MVAKQVLFFDHHADIIGGGQLSLLGLMGHLDPRRYLPRLACPGGGTLAAAARREGILVDEVEMPSLRAPLAAASLWKIRRLVARRGAALLHANSSRAMAYGGVVGRLTGVPVVWHVRVATPASLWYRLLGRMARRIVTISGSVKEGFSRESIRDRVRLVHNGVDTEAFARGDGLRWRQNLGLGNRPLVGMVAQLIPWKRQEDFIRAMAAVAAQHPTAVFVLVGEDPDPAKVYERTLRRLVKDLGLEERVVFTGFCQDVPGIMAMLDVTVLTSENEPFGRVLIEAMAASRPVVATRGGGVAEIVEDQTTGILVTLGDTDAIAQAVGFLLSHPATARSMGTAGRRRAESHFSVRAHARAIEAVYREVLESGEKG